MKVLWLSHFIPYPPKGGALQRSFHLLRELARDHQVYLLAFDDRPQAPATTAVDPCKQALSDICDHVEIVPLPYKGSPLRRTAALIRNLVESVPYSVSLIHSPDMYRKIREFQEHCPVDALHVDAIEIAPYANSVSAKLKILNHQNVESQLLRRRAGYHPSAAGRLYVRLQASKLRQYERTIMPRFDLNLAVSEEDRMEFLKIAPGAPVAVVANGTDVDYFRPSQGPTRPHHLVFVGGMTWFPNWDGVHYFLKDIWPLIRHELADATCELVGRIPADRAFDQLPAGVTAVGYVDDVRPRLDEAAALIVPLRVGGGTRLKILDGLASGKAIVSTSIGCEGLNLLPEKEILIGDTPQLFAQQAIRVCRDPSLRRSLGQAGRTRAEADYAWSRIGAQYSRMILDAFQNAPPKA
jgi:polysaccharide biosynthesis protein PslH